MNTFSFDGVNNIFLKNGEVIDPSTIKIKDEHGSVWYEGNKIIKTGKNGRPSKRYTELLIKFNISRTTTSKVKHKKIHTTVKEIPEVFLWDGNVEFFSDKTVCAGDKIVYQNDTWTYGKKGAPRVWSHAILDYLHPKSKRTKKRNKSKIGKKAVNGGMSNEQNLINELNDWENNPFSKTKIIDMLAINKVNYTTIKKVKAEKSPPLIKPDIKITIEVDTGIFVFYLSLKTITTADFNSVERAKVSKYVTNWNIPKDVEESLKKFAGEIREGKKKNTPLNELPAIERDKVISFFESNKEKIVSDILLGKDKLVTHIIIDDKINSRFFIKDAYNMVQQIIKSNFAPTLHGNLVLGEFTVQRKGGDRGKPSANQLQFKMKFLSYLNKNQGII
jgi:hypothetical protein